MFRIGAFAGLSGVSAKTLRAWDGAGLFRPAWVDPATGYRGYSPAQLPELRRIVALRDVGVPLAEIAALVEGGEDLASVLERRRAALQRERDLVERRLRSLDIQVEGGSDVVVRPIEAERVASHPVGADGAEESAFDALEAWIRDHGRRASRPPGTLLDAGGRPAHVFVPIRGPLPLRDPIAVRRLPARRVASIIHRGPYAGLAAAGVSLDAWLDASGLRSSGPRVVRYLQFGADASLRVPRAWLVDRASDLVTELQQPVA
jgi:DNA-binding transcriptional MerR regulator